MVTRFWNRFFSEKFYLGDFLKKLVNFEEKKPYHNRANKKSLQKLTNIEEE
jgi:phage terminase large subunit-like protein